MDTINKTEIEMLSSMVQDELKIMNELVEQRTGAKTNVKKDYFNKKIKKIKPRVLYLMQLLESLRPKETPKDESDVIEGSVVIEESAIIEEEQFQKLLTVE